MVNSYLFVVLLWQPLPCKGALLSETHPHCHWPSRNTAWNKPNNYIFHSWSIKDMKQIGYSQNVTPCIHFVSITTWRCDIDLGSVTSKTYQLCFPWWIYWYQVWRSLMIKLAGQIRMYGLSDARVIAVWISHHSMSLTTLCIAHSSFKKKYTICSRYFVMHGLYWQPYCLLISYRVMALNDVCVHGPLNS